MQQQYLKRARSAMTIAESLKANVATLEASLRNLNTREASLNEELGKAVLHKSAQRTKMLQKALQGNSNLKRGLEFQIRTYKNQLHDFTKTAGWNLAEAKKVVGK